MPQISHAYAVARIRALEKRLIGRDRMTRLAESDMESAMRLLQEAGYGGQPSPASDVETMIAAERTKTAALVREISPEPDVTGLFLLQADIHNLKALIKSRLLGQSERPLLMLGGLYDIDLLEAAVREGDYSALPPVLHEALTALEKRLQMQENPQLVSVALDKAYMAHAFATLAEHPNEVSLLYFRALADFNNVLALLRLRDIGTQATELEALLLPAGDIPHGALIAAFDQPFEALVRQVAMGASRDALMAGLGEVDRTGRIGALEKARDNALLALVKRGKHDTLTLTPVLGYLLAREQESRSIRLILTAKRNGLAPSVITERLRELYG